VYKVRRKEIKESVTAFIHDSGCGLANYPITLKSLEIYSEKDLDFVDCVLAAYAKVNKIEIATFDSKLRKLVDNNS
jgi:predicted nucleic-acid-binding protein